MTKIKRSGNGYYTLPSGKRVRGADKVLNAAEKMLTLAMGRSEFARKAGLQYSGDRDLFTVAGYVPEGEEKFEHYWSLYQRNPIARRIVSMAPKTTWRNPPVLVEDGADPEEGTELSRALSDVADRTALWRKCDQVDRLSRIGRYGVLLIGVPGEDMALKEEMPRLTGPDDVLYLQAYHEKDAKIEEWERDTQNPRFGLPRLYKIRLAESGGGWTETKATVHWSRVIHVCEDPLGGDVYGQPVLKPLLNTCYDLEKITACTAESYWQQATRILSARIGPDATMTDAELEDLQDVLEEAAYHDLRRMVMTRGVDLGWLDSEPPDPSSVADLYLMLMAAGSGIPRRILFGTETGERASQQDERQWFGYISERQEHQAEPGILRPFADRLIEYGGLPRARADNYTLQWDPLYEENAAEIAGANKTRAEAAKALTPIGGDPTELVEVDEDRNVWLRPTEGEQRPTIPPTPDETDLDEGLPEAEPDAADEQ